MKEILRHGFFPRKQIRCEWCGCVFTYARIDLLVEPDSRKEFVACPECKRILRDKDGEDIQ